MRKLLFLVLSIAGICITSCTSRYSGDCSRIALVAYTCKQVKTNISCRLELSNADNTNEPKLTALRPAYLWDGKMLLY